MAINPTGLNQSPMMPIIGDPTTNPVGAGNYNFGNTQNPTTPQTPVNTNPYAPPNTVTPFGGAPPVLNPPGSPGAGTGTQPVTGKDNQTLQSPNVFGQTPLQSQQTLKRLQDTYGSGMGSLIFQYLQSMGGYNSELTQQTVGATNAAMEQNINTGKQNISSTLGAEGIGPNSSVSALEQSNFLSNAITQMNAIDANLYQQMWSQSSSQELSVIESGAKDVGTYLANQPTGWDVLSNVLSLGQAGAGAASGIVSAVNPNADTGVLDALAGA